MSVSAELLLWARQRERGLALSLTHWLSMEFDVTREQRLIRELLAHQVGVYPLQDTNQGTDYIITACLLVPDADECSISAGGDVIHGGVMSTRNEWLVRWPTHHILPWYILRPNEPDSPWHLQGCPGVNAGHPPTCDSG
jgi:hypothetical protein